MFNFCVQINEFGVELEVVDSFEVGVKSDLIDVFCMNIILFFYDYKDCQYIGVEGDLFDLIVFDQ